MDYIIHGVTKSRTLFMMKVTNFHFLFSLSRLVIACLPRSKRLLISWLQSQSTVIFYRKIKSATVSIAFPSICHEVMGSEAMILVS